MIKNKPIGLYVYKDNKVNGWDVPFCSANDINAKRKMIMDGRNEATIISQFPEEFDLYKLGTFDTYSGTFEMAKDGNFELILSGKELNDTLKKENK